jgi:hypothetical protein
MHGGRRACGVTDSSLPPRPRFLECDARHGHDDAPPRRTDRGYAIRAWASLRVMAADCGWPVAFMFACHRLLEVASGARMRVLPYRIMVQPVGQPGAPLRPDATTVVGRVEPGDALVAQFPRPAPPLLTKRWHGGAACYAATVKGEFAGFVWIQREAYEEDQVRCLYRLPGPQAVWDFDVFVQPRFRLGRTMARLWRYVDETLGADGVRWSFSRIEMYNGASIKSHARLGARQVGRVIFVVIGPWQLALADMAPYGHLSLRASSRPVLELRPPA